MIKSNAFQPVPVLSVLTPLQTPLMFEGKLYYGAADVAKIIGVSRRTVSCWHTRGLFTADARTYDGRYLYEAERVMQLKSVYHPNWVRSGYEPSPTTTAAKPLVQDKPKPDVSVIPATSKKRNVQIYPSKIIYFPNDLFTKRISTLSDEDFANMNSGEYLSLVEIKNHRQFGKIVSPFRIFSDEQTPASLCEAVEQFDIDVLCVCISEYHIGNRYITPGIIYRALTGKVGDHAANPGKIQLADILHSIDKLMRLKTHIKMTDYCEKLNCNAGKSFEIFLPLLPAEYTSELTINGTASNVIQLLEESPLWQIACLKNQVMSFDATLLDVPNQNNSKMNIELKNYVMRRIVEVKAHPQLPHTITFNDLFFKCRLEDSRSDKKFDARNNVIRFLEHLKSEHFIKAFEPVKNGVAIHGIRFTRLK